MKLTTDGLVIWEQKTGEADRIITVLTPNGSVTAYAKNSQRPGGRLTSATALFSFGQFELFKGRNMYTVDSAADKRQFLALSSDVAALSLAFYLCELLKQLAPIEDDAGDFLTLALSALYCLNAGHDRRVIKSGFELKALSLAGYMPLLDGCRECGAQPGEALSFSPKRGDWLCKKCASLAGERLNCSGAAMAAMRYIAAAAPRKVFSFSLPDRQLGNLGDITEKYLEQQLEIRPSTLDFYRLIGQTEQG